MISAHVGLIVPHNDLAPRTEDSLEKETNIRRIPLCISNKFERNGPERCDADELEHAVGGGENCVQFDVGLLD